MIQSIKQTCRFNPVVYDYPIGWGIVNLEDVMKDESYGREFFSQNYVSDGMSQLFHEGMLRLSGNSSQAVFELTQAMGGGKHI